MGAVNSSIAHFKKLGDADGQAFCMTTMMDILLAAGKYFEAVACAKDKIQILQAAGNKQAAAAAFLLLASTLLEHGDAAEAEFVAGKAYQLSAESYDKDGITAAQAALAEAKKAKVAKEIRDALHDSAAYQHLPDRLDVDPGLNKRIQEEYAEFVKA